MSETSQYLKHVEVAEGYVRVKSLLVKLEQMQAVKDLSIDTYFDPKADKSGPYSLIVKLDDDKLIIEIENDKGQKLDPIAFALKPYRRLIQDYFLIVESYEKARLEGNASRLEAIDMGRRGLHNEGADALRTRLCKVVDMNTNTARRLFTLMCILCAGRNLLWL